MMRHLLTVVAAGALVALGAVPASAGTIRLSSPSAFSGSETVVDFETGVTDNAPVPSISGVTFGGLYGEDDGGIRSLFSSPGSMVGTNYFMEPSGATPVSSTITLDFGSSISRVGFDAITNPEDDIDVELFTFSGGSYSSLGSAERFTTGLSDAFVGLEDLSGFDRVRITVVGTSTTAFAMNDLRFEAVVVPLPPAAGMGLVLLFGIGLLRRRRRSAA